LIRRALTLFALCALAAPVARAQVRHRRVVVLELRSGAPAARDFADRLADTLQKLTSLEVISPSEARRRVPKIDGAVARCAGEASCVAQLGARAGGDEVILCGLSQLGDLIIALQRIRVSGAVVEGRIAESLPGGEPGRETMARLLERLLPPDDFTRYGTLRVHARLAGATVLLNGQEIGRTPLPDLTLRAPTSVLVRVIKPGYVPFSARLELLPDSMAEVAPELPAAPAPLPFYKRYWFWAAAGAVAVGTVTAFALTRGDNTADVVIRPVR
jgi:hypothetical protein